MVVGFSLVLTWFAVNSGYVKITKIFNDRVVHHHTGLDFLSLPAAETGRTAWIGWGDGDINGHGYPISNISIHRNPDFNNDPDAHGNPDADCHALSDDHFYFDDDPHADL